MFPVFNPAIHNDPDGSWLYFWEVNEAGKEEQRKIKLDEVNVAGLQYVLWACKYSVQGSDADTRRVLAQLSLIVEEIYQNYDFTDAGVTAISEAVDEVAIKRPAPWILIAPPVIPRVRPVYRKKEPPPKPEPELRRRLILD
jgi:hypothetical protein